MQAHNPIKGHILITSEIEHEIEQLKEHLHPYRVVSFFEENFKIEDAKAVAQEAYISESNVKYIVIAALEFTAVAQNSLLKLLEEPPRNIEFIIISPTKSNLLPTVRSRLPIMKQERAKESLSLDIHLSKIDYREVFEFLKSYARVSKNDAKGVVEALYRRATVEERLILTPKQLDNFDMAYRLLDLNSRPQSVLAMLLMSFAGER